MELNNNTGVVLTTDTLAFTNERKQPCIFNIILANITGNSSTVDIKIFNKKLNTTPDGNELLLYLGKGLPVQANNTLKIGTGDDSYYLTEGDKIYISCPSANTLHFHVNVKTNL
jgi:hypothetical protein